MAFAVTVLYLTGASALLVGKPFWMAFSRTLFLWLVFMIFVTSAGVIAFVAWQLTRRRWASDIVSACMTLVTRWVTRPPTLAELQPASLRRPWGAGVEGAVVFPQALADEFRQIRRHRLWLPRDLTLVVIIIWAAAVVGRILGLGGENMSGVN